jgi:hypothetical protein
MPTQYSTDHSIGFSGLLPYLCCMRILFLILIIAAADIILAQEIKITYDKTKDMSGYKTFRFGETEIITPKDMRVFDEKQLREKVNAIITKELMEKKLQQVDSNAQLVVSYIIGYLERSDVYIAGPLGGTPGAVTTGSVMQDFREGTFVVDLADRSNNMIWRINSTIRYSSTETLSQVEQVVDKGFKKFPNKPKVKKK